MSRAEIDHERPRTRAGVVGFRGAVLAPSNRMKHLNRIGFVFGLALTTSMLGGVALADDPPAQADTAPADTTMMAQKMSASAMVMKVDSDKRDLMLKDDQGMMFKVHVPDDVSRFDAIKKGDHIQVDYYQSIGLSMKKPGAGGQPGASDTTATEKSAGKLPNGVMARTITASVMVMNVDTAGNKVMVKTPDGDMTTINVTDPAMQANLSKLKKGDRIQATYTEAVAISVTPPAADKKSMD